MSDYLDDHDDKDQYIWMTMVISVPVNHDDHGSNQAKAAAEEEKIGTMGEHHWQENVRLGICIILC